jgi:hypothetical protein
MTPSGIEPVTFQFVAQYLNHCATAVPSSRYVVEEYLDPEDERTVFLSTVGKPLAPKDLHDPSQGAGFNSRKTHHTRYLIMIITV